MVDAVMNNEHPAMVFIVASCSPGMTDIFVKRLENKGNIWSPVSAVIFLE